MRTDALRELIGVYDISSVDTGASVVVFNAVEGGLAASYEGAHSGAVRVRADCEIEGLDSATSLAVNAPTLRGLLSIWPGDKELQAKLEGPSLVLKGRGVKSKLAINRAALSGLLFEDMQNPSAVISINPQMFLARLPVLSDVASKKMTQLVLTGVNMRTTRDGAQLVLRTTDKIRAAMTSVPMLSKIEGSLGGGETIALADLQVALSLMQGDACRIAIGSSRVVLQDGVGTTVRLVGLTGSFPELGMLPMTFAHEVDFPSDVFATVCKAAELIDVASRMIKITFEGGHVRFTAQSQELGSFDLAGGETQVEGLTLHVDATYLSVLDKFGDGDVTMRFNDARSPMRFDGGGYYYWLQPITPVGGRITS